VTRRDPSQARQCTGEATHRRNNAIEIVVELPALVALATAECDTFGTFIDAHQREAESRLSRVKFRVHANQRTADPPGQNRSDQGVADGAPHHVTRYSKAYPADDEDEVTGKRPEDADEGNQHQARLKQPHAESCGQFGQLSRLLSDTLVGTDAELAGMSQGIGAP